MGLATPRRRIPRSPPHRVDGRAVEVVDDVLHVEVRRFVAIPDHPEALVGDDLGAGLLAHPAGPAEVVRVAVRDDDGVHPLERDAGAGEALDELGEGATTGQARVDDRHAPLVLQDVAVDVTEAGHVDRQLGPQDAGCHLGDLRRGALLLLATGAIGHPGIVGGARHPVSARTTGVTRWGRTETCDDRTVAWALYAAGWSIGWLLLWSNRRLPPPPGPARPAVAVVVPARDEAASLPRLLTRLVAQLRAGDQLVVVDDHSTDDTAALARSFGATVVAAPELPAGWVGKPHACAAGAAATSAPILVFLDADVRPERDLLDGLATALATDPQAVVSVQPWHAAEHPGERLAAAGQRRRPDGQRRVHGRSARDSTTAVAFGPVLAVTRDAYGRAGGHSHPDVRANLTEDIALARNVGASRLFSDRRDATFRMYPRGFRQSFAGWSRTMAAGVAATRWWLLVAVAAWVTSLAGGPFAGWLAYPLSALQVLVLGRRAGRVGPVLALIYPVLVVVLVGIVARAGWLRVRGTTTWKGRPVRAA